jgi:hypothetical protein
MPPPTYQIRDAGCLLHNSKGGRHTPRRVNARFPEFGDALARGREGADTEVAASLYNRANGYDIQRVAKDGPPYIEHIPADYNCLRFWLTNRQRGRWQDRIEVSHDISDRVADRLEAANLRALRQLVAPTIDVTPVAEKATESG